MCVEKKNRCNCLNDFYVRLGQNVPQITRYVGYVCVFALAALADSLTDFRFASASGMRDLLLAANQMRLSLTLDLLLSDCSIKHCRREIFILI